jgi:hypothetical protein
MGDFAGVFRRNIAQAREGLRARGNACAAPTTLPSASRICTELLTSMGRRRPVDILATIVIVMAVSRGHVGVTMVLMPVSHANADVADLNTDVFRDDHWFVAGAQRASKCRHH